MTLCDEFSKTIISQAMQSKGVKFCVTMAVSFGIASLLVSFILPTYRGLVYLFWLAILSNTFVPIAPHEPVILLYGKLYSPWLVAICAGIAILVIELINYHVLVPLLDLKRIRAFREKPLYQSAEHYFSKLPLLSLLFACFAPIPFTPFRVLAVSTRYSVRRFALSVLLGRAPRFYLLALTGKALNVPIWGYVMILIIAFSIVLTRKLVERKKGSDKERRGAQDGICLS